jgi:glucose/mannose-6-phosphate isomerase
MDYDNLERFKEIDPEGMLAHIDALPDQVAQAWEAGQNLALDLDAEGVEHVIVTGMGGSAIGGSLVAALVEDRAEVPITVNRGYTLPAYVKGERFLVIGSSHSGNTEETLSAFEQAGERGTQRAAITTNGKLSEMAKGAGIPFWQFDYASQPRAALGWSFTLLAAMLARLELIPDLSGEMAEAVDVLRKGKQLFGAENDTGVNPAKLLARRLVDKLPVIYGGGILEPVAMRWKGQFNENAKAFAYWESMPEMNHNAVAGILNPEGVKKSIVGIFLKSVYDHPRVARRHDLTFNLFQENGIMAQKVNAVGESAAAQMFSVIQQGDYTSYYLAMSYEADPTPIPTISVLKKWLAE